jgi:excisionase family DNA binding protein
MKKARTPKPESKPRTQFPWLDTAPDPAARGLVRTPVTDALDQLGAALKGITGAAREVATAQLQLAEGQQRHGKQLQASEARLLSRAAACRRLRIGDATLTYLIRSRQLKTVRVGKWVKIAASEVERLATAGFSRAP